ncbi:MAG: DedA family protein [Candidatus Zixiibacteriota bacterium]
MEWLTSGFDSMLAHIDAINPIYIYLILFGMAFLENIFPPLPGDTFTIIGGYLAAVGKLALIPTFLFITLGTISSVMAVYALGYRGGREFFERKNYRFFNADDLKRVDTLFAKYGMLTLLASRFIVGARVMVAVGAGISKYPTGRMALYSYISGALFHGVLIALAYLFNMYVDRLVDGFNLYSKIILIAVTILVILWGIVFVRRMINGKKQA